MQQAPHFDALSLSAPQQNSAAPRGSTSRQGLYCSPRESWAHSRWCSAATPCIRSCPWPCPNIGCVVAAIPDGLGLEEASAPSVGQVCRHKWPNKMSDVLVVRPHGGFEGSRCNPRHRPSEFAETTAGFLTIAFTPHAQGCEKDPASTPYIPLLILARLPLRRTCRECMNAARPDGAQLRRSSLVAAAKGRTERHGSLPHHPRWAQNPREQHV